MEGARAGRTAGLARDVLERAQRRRRCPAGRAQASAPEDDSERLSAAFSSIVSLMTRVTKECEELLVLADSQWDLGGGSEGHIESLAKRLLCNLPSILSKLYLGRCCWIRSMGSVLSSTVSSFMKYYRFVPACRCKEQEIKHICRYHGRQAEERELESSEEERTEASVTASQAQTCQQCARQASKDIYIEVSPGTYSVTATSGDMVQQTHVVNVNAGQSIDLTFVL